MSHNEQAEQSAVYAQRIMQLERGYDELRTVNNRLQARLAAQTRFLKSLVQTYEGMLAEDVPLWARDIFGFMQRASASRKELKPAGFTFPGGPAPDWEAIDAALAAGDDRPICNCRTWESCKAPLHRCCKRLKSNAALAAGEGK